MKDGQSQAMLTVQLPLELRKAALLAAIQRGTTLSAVVRDALRDFIAESEGYAQASEASKPYSDLAAELRKDGLA